MSPETSSAHRWFRRVLWTALAAAVALFGWMSWRAYDERAAIREAQAAGWRWQSSDPVSLILKSWRNAWRKTTWTFRYRQIVLPDGTDLVAARPLIIRLRPTILVANRCPNTNLDSLQNLHALQELYLEDSTGLQNVNGLRKLHALKELRLDGCTGLKNADGLQGLRALQTLSLIRCRGLEKLDGLKDLPSLQSLTLLRCTGLQAVVGLCGIPSLKWLDLRGCTGIPAPALRELRLALPKADIVFPNRTKNPPPP
jgi:hypothetical protein